MIYKKYICLVCGFIYDEKAGCPDDDIKPYTKWKDISDDWFCPECGVTKDDFEILDNQKGLKTTKYTIKISITVGNSLSIL